MSTLKSKIKRSGYVLIILLCVTVAAHTQDIKSDTIKPIKPHGINTTKIELYYRDVNITQTYTSGNSYSGIYSIPRISINGAYGKDVDVQELTKLFKHCPQAKKEIKLYSENKKKAKQNYWGGFLIGSGIGFAGLLTAAYLDQKGSSGSGAAFGVGFGLGMGTFVTGFIRSRKYRKKSDINLFNSISKYNTLCYTLSKEDSLKNEKSIHEITRVIKKDEEIKQVNNTRLDKDSVFYQLLRNEPKSLRFWTIGVSPLSFEFSNNRGFNMYFQGDVNVQLTSKLNLSADIKKAFIDNLSQATNKNEYRNFGGNPFSSSNYKKAFKSNAIVSYEIFGKDRIKKHEIYLGSERMEGLAVTVLGTLDAMERISWNVRGGYSFEHGIYFSPDGLKIGTTTTGITYETEYFGVPEVLPVPINDMGNAMPMVKSNCISLGMSRKIISDLKVDLVENVRFKGKRDRFGFVEIYGDLLYGLSLKSGDVNYLYRTSGASLEYNKTAPLNTSLTAFSKIGGRLGCNWVNRGFSVSTELGA